MARQQFKTKTDDGGATYLPPSEIAGPVDTGALNPDDVEVTQLPE